MRSPIPHLRSWRCSHHVTYELALPDGRILRTRISHQWIEATTARACGGTFFAINLRLMRRTSGHACRTESSRIAERWHRRRSLDQPTMFTCWSRVWVFPKSAVAPRRRRQPDYSGTGPEALDLRKIPHARNTCIASAWLQLARSLERGAAATHDPRRAEALFERLRRNGTWQSPTLTVLRMMSSPATAFDPEDPRLRYLPESTKDFWRAQLVWGTPSTPEQVEECGRFFEAVLRMVGALERVGAGLIAGSDSGNAHCSGFRSL